MKLRRPTQEEYITLVGMGYTDIKESYNSAAKNKDQFSLSRTEGMNKICAEIGNMDIF